MKNDEIQIRVRLSARQFRAYCAFDTFRIKRRHLPLLIATLTLFTLGMGALLLIPRASTIAGVLIGLAIAVPMVVLGLYVIQIETLIARQGLKTEPEVYAIRLNDAGVTVSGLHRSGGSAEIPWPDLWAAYRDKGAVYLYVNEQRAFILPAGQANVDDDTLWSFLVAHMDSRCFAMK